MLLAGRCQSAKWQVAVGYAWLADGTRENGGGRWFKRLFGYVGLSLPARPQCFIIHTPRLRYRSDVMAGGKKLDGFKLQLRTFDPEDGAQQVRPSPGETPPPTGQLHKVYNLKEIDAIRKGIVP